MKKLNILICAATLAITGCKDAQKTEQNNEQAKDTAVAAVVEEIKNQEPAMDSAAAAKAWENYATPGEMQKWMASQSGKWTCAITSWPAPDAPALPPEESSADIKMILGGRYQEASYKGKMMGMDFEGRSLMGYDNAKKVFVTTWMDNMGTGIMMLEGPYDEATKTIHMSGKMTDPTTGKDTDIRQDVKMQDDKTQITEMYCKQNGKEYKNMEIKMTKK